MGQDLSLSWAPGTEGSISDFTHEVRNGAPTTPEVVQNGGANTISQAREYSALFDTYRVKMDPKCDGCTWISAELSRLEQLRVEFLHAGDAVVAEVTARSISDLLRDWHSHYDRDHAISGDRDSTVQVELPGPEIVPESVASVRP